MKQVKDVFANERLFTLSQDILNKRRNFAAELYDHIQINHNKIHNILKYILIVTLAGGVPLHGYPVAGRITFV